MEVNRRSTIAGFEGKNFYFDLENCPQIRKLLTKFIQELGGEIKGFLDHRIKYIVTNRPKGQWPPKYDNNDTPGKSKVPAIEAIRDQTTQSPINLNKNSSFSRGSLLLSKHQQMVTKPALPTDVLERGRYWNITILNASDVLDFCRRHLSPKVTESVITSAKIRRLKGPHIKVEDNRLKYRPVYKEFFDWPQINPEFQEFLCPFLKKKVQKEAPIEETNESLEGLAAKNRFNDKLNETLNNTTNETIIYENNNNNNETKAKSPTNNKILIKKNLVKRRKNPLFCEICGTDYEDLQEHLKSETHESFTQNEENFRELRGVIQSLQPFNETNNSVKSIHFDDGSDSSDGSEDELLCSPFQSTPNMSTTIQLCGSKHKSHFLPIHDLIGPKSPQEVPQVVDRDCDSGERSSKTDLLLIPPSITSRDSMCGQNINNLLKSCSDDSKDHFMDSTDLYSSQEL